jgi:hypothetical protein
MSSAAFAASEPTDRTGVREEGKKLRDMLVILGALKKVRHSEGTE